jgi:pyruvate ferredoxin oxidoreductase gamma subunit/2-oxoisovalerate ferredoxin oxidoreductase gamma subunit
MIEIRFHGMGGQGAVMGALILAEAAFSEGRYAQKIPVYGGMRRGGDVTVFLRLDDKPVRRTCGVYEPDALVVLDPALSAHEMVRRGLKEGGMAILNDERSPGEVDMGVLEGRHRRRHRHLHRGAGPEGYSHHEHRHARCHREGY